MDYETLIVAKDGPIAVVTINRPKVLNALNTEVVAELAEAQEMLELLPTVRAVVLTGAGEKAFVAGADIAEMSPLGVLDAAHFAAGGHKLMARIEGSRMPWIAAVNGFALGGGCELALACDFIYAAKTARFGQPEVNLGVIPGFGGTQRLLRRVGLAKAKELVFTGDMIGADEALRVGLCDAVVDPAELIAYARRVGEKIAEKGPLAVAAAKKVMQVGQSQPLGDALSTEAHAFSALFDTADQKEGMKAFFEKRRAKFEGR